jgi:aldose 1-epimerase
MPSRPEREVRLSSGPHTVVVDVEAGARATSWTLDGVELLGGAGSGPVEYGMYPMAPWAGRLRGNQVTWNGRQHPLPISHDGWALHGTCLDRPGRVIEQDATTLVVRFDEHPAWPWRAAVQLSWRLESTTLVTTLEVEALDEPFPAVVGWHPWFRRDLGTGGELEWGLEATEQLVRGADHLPTGERIPYDPDAGPFDDAFVVPSGRAWLRWPGALAVDVASEGGWFVVFDGRPEAVCVEPQSGPPDGLDGSHGVAEPGAPVTMRTTWSLREVVD